MNKKEIGGHKKDAEGNCGQDAVLESEIKRLLAARSALAPPIRPSSQDVEWFSQRLSAWDAVRVLILGLTSELVDLAVRNQALRVVVMDWHAPQFAAICRVSSENWTSVEQLVNDWRRFVPELEKSLDVVLGDGCLNFVAFPQEWEQVLLHIRRYLIPGGVVLLRLAFQPEEHIKIDSYLDETLSRFDAECPVLESRQRLELMRRIISEIRLLIVIESASMEGTVDFNRRMHLIRSVCDELERRYSRYREWEEVRAGFPPEVIKGTGLRAIKGLPRWKQAVDLFERCGFTVTEVRESGTRPVPGAMILFAARCT